MDIKEVKFFAPVEMVKKLEEKKKEFKSFSEMIRTYILIGLGYQNQKGKEN